MIDIHKSKMKPKIHIPKTNSERIADIIGYSCYFGSILLLIFIWGDLPDKVPAHYNAIGEVDRWGSKMELLVLPIIGAFLALFMQLFEKFPETHNYPERLNEENAQEFYLLSRKMMNQLKAVCLIILSLLLIESVSIALQWRDGFGAWLLPILIISALIPIIVGMIKQRNIK